jgi:serine/threonine protein kinase
MAGNRSDWEIIEPLGRGGQSEVSLVRGPERLAARAHDIEQILSFSPWQTATADTISKKTGQFAEAVVGYARPESHEELGAMKVFKIRDDEQQAVQRLSLEVGILSERKSRRLPRLLDSNIKERWMVTEFFRLGTLEDNFAKYKGNVALALNAFLSLVETLAMLHSAGIVHRDIKPANVFIRSDNELVLGDFGIVYLPNQPSRPTLTNESVGPHDYMPPWAEGGRLDAVGTKIDIYMLGKLLWCMVSGRLRLVREWFELPENNLTMTFPDDPGMEMINVILRRCVVEQENKCQTSAADLASIVKSYLNVLQRGGQVLYQGVLRPCRVCGVGLYGRNNLPPTLPRISGSGAIGLSVWAESQTTLPVYPYVCSYCGHVEFFTRPAPPMPS